MNNHSERKKDAKKPRKKLLQEGKASLAGGGHNIGNLKKDSVDSKQTINTSRKDKRGERDVDITFNSHKTSTLPFLPRWQQYNHNNK